MRNSQPLFDKIKSSKTLPSLPQVLLELVKACNSEKATVKDLSCITAKDPSLSTKILQLVNSAYVGLNRKVDDIEKAVVYLGADTIKNIALSASVIRVFSNARGDAVFRLNRFWGHSFLCASIAKRIAETTSYALPDEAFLAGLLHDIGKLVLWVNFKQDYTEIIQNATNGNGSRLSEFEAERLGATHAEVGAWLIRQWSLNSLLSDAILYHHESKERIIDAFPLVKIIYLADLLSKSVFEAQPPSTELVEEVLGFGLAQLDDITQAAMQEVKEVARSLDIPIEAPAADVPAVSGPAPDTAPLPPTEPDLDKYEDLFLEIRDISLLYGTIENLLKADSQDDILKITTQGLQILFDARRIFFFLYEEDQNQLVGRLPEGDGQFDLINGLEVPCGSEKSLLVKALLQRQALTSFETEADAKLTIADEQLIRLLGTDGMLCLPMIVRGTLVGVLVAGLYQLQYKRMAPYHKLLRMYANQVAICLHVDQMRRQHAFKIHTERMEAYATIARKVAHEINNPLGIIKNFLTILGLKLSEDNSAIEELRIISEEIDRVTKIVNYLSAFSEPPVEQEAAVDIHQLLSSVVKIMKPSVLAPGGIRVHMSLSAAQPNVRAEAGGLKQVFINLIKNAAEAMTEGGNLYIGTRLVDPQERRKIGDEEQKPPTTLEVLVRDDGPGIAPDIYARLFEPYNTSKDDGHSGLGLSIVHSIISKLGGTISCESEPGAGTTFRLRLNLHQAK